MGGPPAFNAPCMARSGDALKQVNGLLSVLFLFVSCFFVLLRIWNDELFFQVCCLLFWYTPCCLLVESRGTLTNRSTIMFVIWNARNPWLSFSPIAWIGSTRLSWSLDTGVNWAETCPDGASRRMMLFPLTLVGSRRNDCFDKNNVGCWRDEWRSVG